MAQNRLHLDFSINGTADRKKFIDQYILRPEFTKFPLTNDELETIANYILWGKDPDGQNPVQKKEFQIETRNKTWQRDNTESLDALLESPTFNEASLRNLTAKPKIVRENFDRTKALRECPSHLRQPFLDLFRQIDTIELGINFYEMAHGKRTKFSRDSLTKEFSPEQITQIQTNSQKWSQAKYLKMRHIIVELRREQFTMRDTYVTKITRHSCAEPEIDYQINEFDAEIPVFPLGLKDGPYAPLVFPDFEMAPSAYTPDQISQVIKYYWQKKDMARPRIYFDFENPEHLYKLIGFQDDLQDSSDKQGEFSTTQKFLDTLEYYIARADLSLIQRDILQMKIDKKRNQDIVEEIFLKYNKQYTINYISTIFTQKIIPKIIEAVKTHSTIVENLSFKENFKVCNKCHKELLINPENFVRRARSKDGFSNRCKNCDKLDRQQKKEVIL